MANTIVVGKGTIHITFDGATAYDIASGSGLTNDPTDGLKVKSLLFIPSAADDAIVVRDEIAAGAPYFEALAIDAYDEKIKYFAGDRRLKLYIVGNQASSGSKLLIEF